MNGEWQDVIAGCKFYFMAGNKGLIKHRTETPDHCYHLSVHCEQNELSLGIISATDPWRPIISGGKERGGRNSVSFPTPCQKPCKIIKKKEITKDV